MFFFTLPLEDDVGDGDYNAGAVASVVGGVKYIGSTIHKSHFYTSGR